LEILEVRELDTSPKTMVLRTKWSKNQKKWFGSQFLLVEPQFWPFLLDQFRVRFLDKLIGLIRFLKTCLKLNSKYTYLMMAVCHCTCSQ